MMRGRGIVLLPSFLLLQRCQVIKKRINFPKICQKPFTIHGIRDIMYMKVERDGKQNSQRKGGKWMGKKKGHKKWKRRLLEATILLLVAVLNALTSILNLLSAD